MGGASATPLRINLSSVPAAFRCYRLVSTLPVQNTATHACVSLLGHSQYTTAHFLQQSAAELAASLSCHLLTFHLACLQFPDIEGKRGAAVC